MFGPARKELYEGSEVLVNNNKNKSPVPGGYMSNTTHKTEERSFQEERRDVMKMNKMFTGLIALVAGVALSAGSAFATKGYVGGDPAVMKLVPYYETGDSRATIIGIQNLSTQEVGTMNRNNLVAGLQSFLDGEEATAAVQTYYATGGGGAGRLDPAPVVRDGPTAGTKIGEGLDNIAKVEEDLEKAMMAVQDEHLFVAVNVYDAMGMMMENASAELCLKEHQFGVIVLQGPSAMMAEGYQMQTLSMMDGDIPAYGYVEIMADTTKYSACGSESFRDPVDTIITTDTGARSATPVDADLVSTKTMVAAWTIIQDVGMGFFGTEVPTSTISKEMTGDDASTTNNVEMGDPEIACYMSDPSLPTASGTADAVAGVAANRSGPFQMTRCGLIPERHVNMKVADDGDATTLAPFVTDETTPRAHALARYDAGDESMVYVWLAEGMDMEGDHPSMARMLDVVVKCEDGTVMTGMDQYGDPTDAIAVAAPGMLTMIDPTMGAVGEATDMCEGDRGVLRITMPDGSHAGAVFSHVTQMGGHYRMNFPGYSMASDVACSTATGVAAQRAACM